MAEVCHEMVGAAPMAAEPTCADPAHMEGLMMTASSTTELCCKKGHFCELT